MQLDDAARLIDAIARLIGAVAWPAAVLIALALLRPAIREFLSSSSEIRLKGAGFEASAQRRLDLDQTSQKLHEFWKPAGRLDRTNSARIAACMRQLGITGTVPWLINAGTAEDRARVLSCLMQQTGGGGDAE